PPYNHCLYSLLAYSTLSLLPSFNPTLIAFLALLPEKGLPKFSFVSSFLRVLIPILENTGLEYNALVELDLLTCIGALNCALVGLVRELIKLRKFSFLTRKVLIKKSSTLLFKSALISSASILDTCFTIFKAVSLLFAPFTDTSILLSVASTKLSKALVSKLLVMK